MGGIGSRLKKEEIEELIHLSGFTLTELKRIYKKFATLDLDHKEWVSVDEFLNLAELENNPLKDRIARLMTVDMGEMIDFRLFAETISLFNDRIERTEKFKFFFRLYDIDCDGFVGESELLFMFKTIAGHEYTDNELQGIVDQIIMTFDKDGDKRLNYEEFVSVFRHPEMEFL